MARPFDRVDVLDALAEGHDTVAGIADRLGAGTRTVLATLNRMWEDGAVARTVTDDDGLARWSVA